MSENPAWWSALADSQQSSGSWLHQKKPLSIMQTLPIITRFNHRLCLQHRFYDWPYQLCNYISCYKTIQLQSSDQFILNLLHMYSFYSYQYSIIFEYILVSTINTRCMGHGDQILSTASNPPSINLDKLSLLEHL